MTFRRTLSFTPCISVFINVQAAGKLKYRANGRKTQAETTLQDVQNGLYYIDIWVRVLKTGCKQRCRCTGVRNWIMYVSVHLFVGSECRYTRIYTSCIGSRNGPKGLLNSSSWFKFKWAWPIYGKPLGLGQVGQGSRSEFGIKAEIWLKPLLSFCICFWFHSNTSFFG